MDELFCAARSNGKNFLVLKKIQEALSHSSGSLSDVVQYLVDNSEISVELSTLGVRVSDGESWCTLYGGDGESIWILPDMSEPIEAVCDILEYEDCDSDNDFDKAIVELLFGD